MIQISITLLLSMPINLVFGGYVSVSVEKSSHSLHTALANESCGIRYYDSGFPVDTRLFEHPWLARFGYKRNGSVRYIFQGLLIHPQYVLTTVYVAKFDDWGELTHVRLGEHNNSTETDCEALNTEEEICARQVQDILVDEVIIHPAYDLFQQVNDVALVKLRVRANVDGRSVALICLNQKLHVESPFLLLASWCGRRDTGLSVIPKQYKMKSISPSKCKKLMPSYTVQLTNGMFCVVFDEKHTTHTVTLAEPNLRGANGAPVYTVNEGNRMLLIGLLSYGPRYPAKLHEPYVITTVAPLYEWLSQMIGNNSVNARIK